MKGVVAGIIMVLCAVAGFQPSFKSARAVPAIYVLGDSTLDVGNNNYLLGKSVPNALRPFYGVDFPGGPMPTGRYSNGYNIADYIAKNLGFKRSPPAYLSLEAHHRQLVRSALHGGVSYASAGAGILDSTNAGNNIPLSKQVKYFHLSKLVMEAKEGSQVVSDHLARSFFILGIGSNDLYQFVLEQQAKNKSATQSDAAALYDSLMSNYSATITDLYTMGARKIGIINAGATGCIPRVRAHTATGACDNGLNELVVGFNGALSSFLAGGLAPKLPGLAYSLADNFAHRLDIIAHPQAAGFVDTASACCGSGKLGAEGDCLPTSRICENRDGYIYWDWIHATQRAAELAAQAFFRGPAQFTTPISFKQLAEKSYPLPSI
ncbi:GDSL esterase/lipase At5g37690-like [Lolium rigidum]|uniref:GDSL esterase/lipase At5g37690-like n=1 Tax=Lolium rigidum TaxID=89674 RepID=UPI001F5E19CA|nr:GDSL esterase/lipase At5g37690-like [Lolium rigidum]